MDILGQYNEQHPSRGQARGSALSPDLARAGFIIRIIVKLSGGRIKNEQQANVAMVTMSLTFLLGSVIALWWGF